MLKCLWFEDDGVLTLEWILLTTFVVLGAIGGLAAIRDALVAEQAGVVGAISSLDQSYTAAPPIAISVGTGGNTVSGNCGTSVAGSQMLFLDSSSYGVGRISTNYGQANGQNAVACTVSP